MTIAELTRIEREKEQTIARLEREKEQAIADLRKQHNEKMAELEKFNAKLQNASTEDVIKIFKSLKNEMEKTMAKTDEKRTVTKVTFSIDDTPSTVLHIEGYIPFGKVRKEVEYYIHATNLLDNKHLVLGEGFAEMGNGISIETEIVEMSEEVFNMNAMSKVSDFNRAWNRYMVLAKI